jgi:hypothetical protein
MTRSFAHYGLAPLNLYVGEAALALFLIGHPEAVFHRLFSNIVTPSLLQGFSLVYLVYLCYGIFELLRGVATGYPALTAVQGFAFHVYPLYLFVGLWVGQRHPHLLPKLVRQLAWIAGVYGLIFIAVLSDLPIMIPGSGGTPIFGQPNGSALIILALLSFEKDLFRVSHLLIMNLFILFGMQVRAEFLMLVVGLCVWGVLTRNLGRLATGVAAVVFLFAIGFVTDVRVPAPAGRGGEISARYILGRSLSIYDVELAAQYAPSAKTHAGTYQWRTRWWKAIWATIHENPVTVAIGEGYGYPLTRLVTYINDPALRTPHNIFYYCLAYQGWLGVGLFVLLQVSLGACQWRVYKETGQPYGFVLWTMVLAGACFSNSYETPFGAIPFYLLCGLTLAPLESAVESYEDLASPQLLPAARW